MGNSKIGFIGLGTMGKPMAKRLRECGYEVTVHNRSQGAVQELVRCGAYAVATPREVAQWSDVAITMLPDTSDVTQVLLEGPDAVIKGVKPGMTVIDMSSILPSVCAEYAKVFKRAGVDFLDAPVSGGPQPAADGKLSIMVGGKESVFLRHEEVFRALGTTVKYCGSYGQGQVMKLINQIDVAEKLLLAAHDIVRMKQCGIKPAVGVSVLMSGLAGNTVLERKAPLMIARKFTPAQFRAALHLKDLRNAETHFREQGDSVDRIVWLREQFEKLVAQGYGDEDHAAIFRIVEEEVRS